MFKLTALLLAAFVAAASCSPIAMLDGWETFKSRFNKTYTDPNDEQVHRLQWQNNLFRINNHNERYNLGLTTFTLGVNRFTDMSSGEFVAFFNGLRMPTQKRVHHQIHTDSGANIPDTVDWRTKKVVTPVKNQQQCGSCWAFSATGSLEGQHALKNKKLVSLSEQNLVDCSGPQGDNGCEGGLMDDAFAYVKQNHGIDTEASYPYTAEDGNCAFKHNAIGATLKSWTDVESGDESALTNAIATVGPISVAIDASNPSFQAYSSGVYFEDQCSSSQLDHGVLAVGYGKKDGSEYYLVKNSWGADWGMDGYIMMSRNKDNNCGIATMSSYPVV